MSAWVDTVHNIEEPIQNMKLEPFTQGYATIEDDSSDGSDQEKAELEGNPKIADAFMTGRCCSMRSI